MTFATRLEHQFMQRLRRAGWVNATALPPSRRLVQTLLQKGWIEATRSGPKNVVLYRLTGEGLNAKKLPIPILHRRRPSSKGKFKTNWKQHSLTTPALFLVGSFHRWAHLIVGGREERRPPRVLRSFRRGPPARLCSDRDELMQRDPANRAHGAALEVVEHEQADRRRQVALLAGCVDLADQLGQRHAAYPGNLLHAAPERLFEADAGLVAADNDRALHHGRLIHC